MFKAGLVALSFMWALCAHGKVLYTGSSTPASQGWFGPLAGTQTLDPGGFVTLNTSASGPIQGGYGRIEPLLESSPGFRLDFTARVISEVHDRNDRAGFSLIVTDGAKHGIEIAFWEKQIWPQNVGFSHAASQEVAFDTAAMTDYSLTVIGGHYQLNANGQKLFAGTTVFYDANGLVFAPDIPYRTPHVLFFGDDTTSASATFSLQSVTLTTVPEPGILAVLCAGLAVLTCRVGRTARRAIQHT
jgi:hypothetical protein